MKEKTKELEFWTGNFGKEYVSRNIDSTTNIHSRIHLWSKVMNSLVGESFDNGILEVGCNLGINLRALKSMGYDNLFGLEPYKDALEKCIADNILDRNNAYCTSVFDEEVMGGGQFDLVFTSGVLIHINPDDLQTAINLIVNSSRKYIVCVEYFSDVPESILYRGHKEKLFKRDFGSFYLDNHPELKVRDYGFLWKRVTGIDNVTWWLLEKR